MSQQAEHRVGNVIGSKWRVDALLGAGSMAAVYAVTHRNGARAALKILHPTLCADPAVCERFLGEGYLTNSVKHPGIVRVLDDGVTDDGCVFLVMDLLEGMTLEALRQERGGQIDLREVMDIADKLMDALHAVHEGGIIHRDLKPQNVFVCDDGSVKLLDFGVARVLDQGAQSKLSMFGLVLGTPSFMSPEQALGARDRVNHLTDIWSLGATLFTSLTGQTVHLGPSAQARLLAAAKMKARSIALVKQDLPPMIASAIDMALRFKPEERWQSVEAFRRAFHDARTQLGWETPESGPTAAWLQSQESPALAPEGGASQPEPAGDHGERALALLVRSNHPPEARRAESDPPPPRAANGTFIGVGDPRSAPPEPRPDDGEGFNTKTVRLPGSLRPPRSGGEGGEPFVHRPRLASAAEGSYPAASSTLEMVDGRRRSSLGKWLVALALVAITLGGVAFFAVNRASARNAQSSPSATVPPQALTSATPSAAIAPSLTEPNAVPSASSTPLAAQSAGLVATIDAGTKGGASPAPARTTHAAPQAVPGAHPPRSQPRSTPTQNPRPPEPPPLPPDPFGTPD